MKMGYGGSRNEAAELIGKTGDEGIDGTIKEDRLGLDVMPLLAFYEDINTQGDNNLYDTLFQNKQITYPLNPDFALANVNSGLAITEIHKSSVDWIPLLIFSFTTVLSFA